jgi:hypothetical protein
MIIVNLKVSKIRSIVGNFVNEKFGVNDFRITAAVPDESSKLWKILVSYSVPISKYIKLNDDKSELTMNEVRYCY